MATLQLTRDAETIVVRFGGEQARINAYTLASALQGIADAAKAANAALNPGFEVEVVVEAVSPGSFQTTLRTVFRGAGNLFTTTRVEAVILGIIATVIYEHTLADRSPVQVQISTDEVVIVRGNDRVVVPRVVYDAKTRVEENPRFRAGIGQAFRALDADPAVTSIGVSTDPRLPPPVTVPREEFAALPAYYELVPGDARDIEEVTELQIVRAILERSSRRWEFAWNGIKIAAPVLDDAFYDEFFAHRITIAPGDSLRVKMRIVQFRSRDLGVFMNQKYEVLEVLRHIPRSIQGDLGDVRPES
jgi:hypothetical protein